MKTTKKIQFFQKKKLGTRYILFWKFWRGHKKKKENWGPIYILFKKFEGSALACHACLMFVFSELWLILLTTMPHSSKEEDTYSLLRCLNPSPGLQMSWLNWVLMCSSSVYFIFKDVKLDSYSWRTYIIIQKLSYKYSS